MWWLWPKSLKDKQWSQRIVVRISKTAYKNTLKINSIIKYLLTKWIKQFMWIGCRASRAIFIFRYIQSWLLIFRGDLVIVSWRNSGLNQNRKPHRALWQSPCICTGRDPALLVGNDSQEMCPDKALLPRAAGAHLRPAPSWKPAEAQVLDSFPLSGTFLVEVLWGCGAAIICEAMWGAPTHWQGVVDLAGKAIPRTLFPAQEMSQVAWEG